MSKPKQPWPRLSVDLKGEKHPDRCQSCSTSRRDLFIWQECDDHDQPELIIVMLCKPCSDRLIEPHPRLYRERKPFDPIPGIMEFCHGCRHRDGVSCANPEAGINGGPGLTIIGPKPGVLYVDGTKKGRRHGWKEIIYPGPPLACTGFEPIPAKETDDGESIQSESVSSNADPDDPNPGQHGHREEHD